jgi:23S rRNA (uracil1939-C5)-methyltransferase
MTDSTAIQYTPSSATVAIDRLVYGGDGLGRLPSGAVVMAPFTVPGETVTIQWEETKPGKRFFLGQLAAPPESPSPDRMAPRCSVFGECGGCQWQHLSYDAQLNWKREIVQESLQRIGKLRDVPVQPTIGTSEGPESAWHYRNKVHWVVSPKADGGWTVGYHPLKSHDVIGFEHCHIIPPAWTDLAHFLEQALPARIGWTGIQVQTNAEGQWLLRLEATQHEEPMDSEVSLLDESFQRQLTESFPAIHGGVVAFYGKHTIQELPLFGESFLWQTLGDKRFRLSSDSFFQVNTPMTLKLLECVDRILSQQTAAGGPLPVLLDAYAGVGLFAIWLARNAQRVLAIESAPSALGDAQENLLANQCQHIELLPGKVETVLAALDEPVPIALLDPPRAGCSEPVLDWLTRHVTERIIYVSCDPTTLARDLKHLVAAGWQIDTVQPFDLFPQTYHVETVTTLTRPLV